MQYKPNFSAIEPTLINVEHLADAVNALLAHYPVLEQCFTSIAKKGGTAYLVGGAVRDLLLGLPIHDLDIEVHGMSMQELSAVLSPFGQVNAVGKSFGVLKMGALPVDWALPRTDTAGRKPDVSINPHMGITEALRRRDLTMNAMAINVHTHELIDPFGGIADMRKKVLRSPDVTFFSEDPLRFYRVMQFIGRFEMCPDDALEHICRTMDISQVSIERIEDEFEKLILKSKRPSYGLRWLVTVHRLQTILPELAHMQSVKQDVHWHPEGCVFEHLMQAIDAAALLEYASSTERLIISYAALCHDLGKVSTSTVKNGRIKSPGHAEAGVALTKSLLRRITRKKTIIDSCATLVKHHMQPGQFIQLHSTLAAYRRLAIRLAAGGTSIDQLVKLAIADHRGRNGEGHEPLTTTPHFIKVFVKRAEEAAGTPCPPNRGLY